MALRLNLSADKKPKTKTGKNQTSNYDTSAKCAYGLVSFDPSATSSISRNPFRNRTERQVIEERTKYFQPFSNSRGFQFSNRPIFSA
jgi:hypothetical protein